MGKTVHALLHGQPLCKFSREMPREWPTGHVWTGVENLENINCPPCKAEAEKLAKDRKG